MPTVTALAARGFRWVVPLGVGAHLRSWGVKETDITELDWWESLLFGHLTVTATPARHYSGRGPRTARTLWAGWAFTGPTHRAFYSGDTGLHEEFVEIGKRLGPFDLTMMDVGEYHATWADIHMGPEQAVLAHQLVRGRLMLPVHWGTFNLAPHGWTEPIERTLVAAEAAGVRVVTPRPGGMMEPATAASVERWWPRVLWQTAEQAPVRSSGVRLPRNPAGVSVDDGSRPALSP
jgi:L-ascorbate metabolism protein UlaG (beta-lactamase superfamily)